MLNASINVESPISCRFAGQFDVVTNARDIPCAGPNIRLRRAKIRHKTPTRRRTESSTATWFSEFMTKTYVVSGRGMKFDAALWPVPANVEIHFYFQCMREPHFYKTRTILDKVMLEVGMFPDRVASPGEMIPSHFCWAHPGGQPASGVFRRQTGHVAMDLSGSGPTRPVALSHVVKALTADRPRGATTIHWIVREDADTADLAGLDCLFPARLRTAAVEDGEESHHVPLAEAVPLSQVGLGPFQDWRGVNRRANTR